MKITSDFFITREMRDAGLHRKTVIRTYVALGFAFLCMLTINIYAYVTILKMSEMNTYYQNSALNIKFKLTNANLLFREVISGTAVNKDMNSVWKLIIAAKDHLKAISDDNPGAAELDKRINTYRDMLMKCFKEKDSFSAAKAEKLRSDYSKSYSDLIAQVDNIELSMKGVINKKMLTFKTLYIALLINFLILFWFTIFTFRSYILKQRRTEVNLISAQSDLVTVFNSVDSMLVSIETDGTITHWNTSSEKYFKVPQAKAKGQRVWVLLPFLMSYKTKIETVILSKKPLELFKEPVYVMDSDRVFNLAMNALSQGGGGGVVIKMEDVTKLELREQHLRQSQKMEVVENMIGGLALDFNNVLGAITGTISMLKYSLENNANSVQDIKDNIDIIEGSAERAVIMVQQLLSLFEKKEMAFTQTDLNNTVMNVLKICENSLDKKISLEAELYDMKAAAMADGAQLEQVLLNLCDNAVQAMTIMKPDGGESGGTLSLSISRAFADHAFKMQHPEAVENSYWVISVEDTGVGMDEETMRKVFDPFFTTKSEIGSTGLGLTFVQNVMMKHKGFVEVSSEPGVGTAIDLFIPEHSTHEQAHEEVVEEEYVEEEAAPPQAEAPVAPKQREAPMTTRTAELPEVGREEAPRDDQIPTGEGLVLVVDDEDIMRKTASNILEKLGYEVIIAEDGQEAVEFFKENYKEIKVTLLDLAMPVMSGKEAYVEMRKIDPKLKVILISGFKQDDRISDLMEMGLNSFVQKPFSMVTLAQEVSKVINSPPSQGG